MPQLGAFADVQQHDRRQWHGAAVAASFRLDLQVGAGGTHLDQPHAVGNVRDSDRIRSIAGPGITLGCGCIWTRAMSSVSSRQPAACNASASVVLPCFPGAATITARPFRSTAAACSDRSPWRVNVTIEGTPQRCISRRSASVLNRHLDRSVERRDPEPADVLCPEVEDLAAAVELSGHARRRHPVQQVRFVVMRLGTAHLDNLDPVGADARPGEPQVDLAPDGVPETCLRSGIVHQLARNAWAEVRSRAQQYSQSVKPPWSSRSASRR